MSNIDWSKSPDGAELHVEGCEPNWWRGADGGGFECYGGGEWRTSHINPTKYFSCDAVTFRAVEFQPFTSTKDAQPKHAPYNRDEALQFLVEQLDSWPTDTSFAPTCPGWGWSNESRQPEFEELEPENSEFQAWIGIDSWMVARPDFVPFVSAEDAQPEGRKLDGGKAIMGAIPPDAELAVARVLTFGAEKYARDNWRKVPDMDVRYMDAALRHLNAYRRGEPVDSESGESHLAHAACCIMFLLQIKEESK
ncbi:MAG: dATP/dGTP diphosphohydrolase domain-containing protein [Aeromonadaceae bacterium]